MYYYLRGTWTWLVLTCRVSHVYYWICDLNKWQETLRIIYECFWCCWHSSIIVFTHLLACSDLTCHLVLSTSICTWLLFTSDNRIDEEGAKKILAAVQYQTDKCGNKPGNTGLMRLCLTVSIIWMIFEWKQNHVNYCLTLSKNWLKWPKGLKMVRNLEINRSIML